MMVMLVLMMVVIHQLDVHTANTIVMITIYVLKTLAMKLKDVLTSMLNVMIMTHVPMNTVTLLLVVLELM
jgi:hypothetical protein